MIFEDRITCPAFVFVKADPPIDTKEWEEISIATWEDGIQTGNSSASVYDLNRGYYIEATKGRYFEAALLGGWPAEWMKDGYLLIPEGNMCPDGVGAYFGLEVGYDELYEAPLSLTRLYADVYFDIEGASSHYGIGLEVKGAVDGYMYPGAGLHYGPYVCEAVENSYEERYVRIPRQVPFSDFGRSGPTKAGYEFENPEDALDYLVAEIYIENKHDGSMRHYMSLPLGDIITEKGYDWSSPVLDDIRVSIKMFDDSVISLKVSVRGWTVVVIGKDKMVI